MSKAEKKKRLIGQLAHFLVDNQAAKSILLEVHRRNPPPAPMPNLSAEWSALYQASPIQGWSTYEQAVEDLEDLFS